MLPRLQEKGRFGAAALDEFVVCINIIKSTRSGQNQIQRRFLKLSLVKANEIRLKWHDSAYFYFPIVYHTITIRTLREA